MARASRFPSMASVLTAPGLPVMHASGGVDMSGGDEDYAAWVQDDDDPTQWITGTERDARRRAKALREASISAAEVESTSGGRPLTSTTPARLANTPAKEQAASEQELASTNGTSPTARAGLTTDAGANYTAPRQTDLPTMGARIGDALSGAASAVTSKAKDLYSTPLPYADIWADPAKDVVHRAATAGFNGSPLGSVAKSISALGGPDLGNAYGNFAESLVPTNYGEAALTALPFAGKVGELPSMVRGLAPESGIFGSGLGAGIGGSNWTDDVLRELKKAGYSDDIVDAAKFFRDNPDEALAANAKNPELGNALRDVFKDGDSLAESQARGHTADVFRQRAAEPLSSPPADLSATPGLPRMSEPAQSTLFSAIPDQPLPPTQPQLMGEGYQPTFMDAPDAYTGPSAPSGSETLSQAKLRSSVVRSGQAGEGIVPASAGGQPPKPPRGLFGDANPEELVPPPGNRSDPLKRLWDEATGVVGLARTTAATLDVSAILRQMQGLGWNNKAIWADAAKDTVRAFASDEAANAAKSAWQADDFYALAQKSGMKFFDWGADAAERSPQFSGLNSKSRVSRFVNEAVGVKNSERSYAVGLNSQGMQAFRKVAEPMWDAGIRDARAYEQLANVINAGRGASNYRMAKALSGTNALFSASNMLAIPERIFQPFSVSMAPEVRAYAAKNLASYLGGQTALLGFLGLTGSAAGGLWSVNADPTSSDFGKVRVGDHHIDTTGGLSPLVHLIARAATGRSGDNETNWKPELARFFRNKESPWASAMTDIALGKDWRGKDVSVTPEWAVKRLVSMYAPFLTQDVVSAWQTQQGSIAQKAAAAGGIGAASAIGLGTNSYLPSASQQATDVWNQNKQAIIGQLPQELQSLAGVDKYSSLTADEKAKIKPFLESAKPGLSAELDKSAADSDSIFSKTKRNVQGYESTKEPTLNAGSAALINGTEDPRNIKAELDDIVKELRGAGGLAYGTQEYKDAIAKLPANDIYKVQDEYYQIADAVAESRGWHDWDAIGKLQQDYLSDLAKTDPTLAERLYWNINEQTPKFHPLLQERADINQALGDGGYYQLDTKGKDAWRAAHPEIDVQMWYLGYSTVVKSDAAAQLAKQMAPKRTVKKD